MKLAESANNKSNTKNLKFRKVKLILLLNHTLYDKVMLSMESKFSSNQITIRASNGDCEDLPVKVSGTTPVEDRECFSLFRFKL